MDPGIVYSQESVDQLEMLSLSYIEWIGFSQVKRNKVYEGSKQLVFRYECRNTRKLQIAGR